MATTLFIFHSQIPSFGSITEIVPSAEDLPTVDINIDKEATCGDLKVIFKVLSSNKQFKSIRLTLFKLFGVIPVIQCL